MKAAELSGEHRYKHIRIKSGLPLYEGLLKSVNHQVDYVESTSFTDKKPRFTPVREWVEVELEGDGGYNDMPRATIVMDPDTEVEIL